MHNLDLNYNLMGFDTIEINLKGVPKKTSLNLRHSFCLITLATNMLEGWNIIKFKAEIHCSVCSTKTFMYDIRELRYKPNNMKYQILKILINDQSNIFKSYTATIYP